MRDKAPSNLKIGSSELFFRRDPSSLSNGKKKEAASEDPSSEQDNGKPKATRNILLIRHSQYNLSGNSDKERILTPLGAHYVPWKVEQAAVWGGVNSHKYTLMLGSTIWYDDPCVSTSRSWAGRADGQEVGSVGTEVWCSDPLQHGQGYRDCTHHQQTPPR